LERLEEIAEVRGQIAEVQAYCYRAVTFGAWVAPPSLLDTGATVIPFRSSSRANGVFHFNQYLVFK